MESGVQYTGYITHTGDLRRIDTLNTHGTGCTLSSALAAQLAKGLSLTEAARIAKTYINNAIIHGAHQNIGHGHGPVAHFY